MGDQELTDLITPPPLIIDFTPSSPPSVQFGAAQQVLPSDNRLVPTNEAIDMDRTHDEPTDQLQHLPSPLIDHFDLNYPLLLSNDAQPVAPRRQIPDDDVLLLCRESRPETVQSQDDDIEIIASESRATESVENPVQPDPTHATIVNALTINPVIIDLTVDDDEVQSTGTTSPLTVDLTQEVDQVQIPPVIDLTQDDEDEQPPDADSPSQAIDQQGSVTDVTENLSQRIETVIRSTTQRKKRASSSDDILVKKQTHKPGAIKRFRKTAW